MLSVCRSSYVIRDSHVETLYLSLGLLCVSMSGLLMVVLVVRLSNVCLVIRSYFFFFFSSRRRHTRCLSDWSSDVCSSDLTAVSGAPFGGAVSASVIADVLNDTTISGTSPGIDLCGVPSVTLEVDVALERSEERRVGKECRCRGSR